MVEVSPVLVGRAEALALAARRWSSAVAGPAHVLLVAGEAGIGKSRLLAALPGLLTDAPDVVDAATFPRDSDAAGAVVLAIAEGFRRAEQPAVATALRSRLLQPDDAGDTARRRRVLVGDLSAVIQNALDQRLTLLRLEDLHWADDLSLEVLERVVAVRGGRGMIVATYRNDDVSAQTVIGRWRARLLSQRFAEELRLPRFDLAETGAVVEAVTGLAPTAEVLAELHARSDGVPLYIEELLAAGGDAAVPDTVVGALAARAESLDAPTRAVLDAAAVIGRSFDLDLLGAVTGGAAAALDDALERLVSAHLVVARDEQFVFRHALLCDAVYVGLPPLRRRSLHSAVANAAERVGLSESYISYHYEKAHDAPRAFTHAMDGARGAAHISAHREAAELFARAQRTASADLPLRQRARLHADLAVELAAVDDNEAAVANFERAIAAFRELGDEVQAALLAPPLMAALHLLGADLERRTAVATQALRRIDLSEGGGDSAVRAALYAALAAAHMLDRNLADALDYGRRAVALIPDSDTVARANIDPTLGSVLVFAGRSAEGWALLDRCIVTSSTADLEAQTARAYRMLASTASVVVEYDRADAALDAGLEYTARAERWNDHHYMASHRAHVQWARGALDAATTTASTALASGRGITTRITALVVLGYVALAAADPSAARARLDEALTLAEQMRELQRVSPVLWGLAEAALQQHDADSAIDYCERALADSERVADAAYLFPFVVTGTRAYLALRDPGLARDWLRRCADLLKLRAIAGTLPAIDHAGGLIALAEGQTGAARAQLERASAAWDSLSRWWEGSLARVALATCAARSRRPADAARLLTEVRERGGALFTALAEQVSVAPAAPSPLSARESEVASLVAAGLTNREIAERLVIAPKTASAHVEHILAKLGVSRRAEIASWMARHG